MKFGQLIETFFLKNHAKNGEERLLPDPLFFKVRQKTKFNS